MGLHFNLHSGQLPDRSQLLVPPEVASVLGEHRRARPSSGLLVLLLPVHPCLAQNLLVAVFRSVELKAHHHLGHLLRVAEAYLGSLPQHPRLPLEAPPAAAFLLVQLNPLQRLEHLKAPVEVSSAPQHLLLHQEWEVVLASVVQLLHRRLVEPPHLPVVCLEELAQHRPLVVSERQHHPLEVSLEQPHNRRLPLILLPSYRLLPGDLLWDNQALLHREQRAQSLERVHMAPFQLHPK